jgi:1-acyl-sn-glycerol-3-phosphate acyltransferase
MTEQAQPTYRVPLPNRIARHIMKPAFQVIFRLLANVKVTGVENVPYGKPYLAAINHISLFDPPFALTFWPEMIEAMGASTIWERPGEAQVVQAYHVIPVHRGDFDKALFDTVLSILRSGRPLLIAPEGTRSHREEMGRARPGIAFIIERAQVPVLPVGIVGTTDDFFKKAIRAERRTLELRIGKPIVLPPVEGKGDERRDIRQRNADLVMAHIAGLLPEHYRGYYASAAIEPQNN